MSDSSLLDSIHALSPRALQPRGDGTYADPLTGTIREYGEAPGGARPVVHVGRILTERPVAEAEADLSRADAAYTTPAGALVRVSTPSEDDRRLIPITKPGLVIALNQVACFPRAKTVEGETVIEYVDPDPRLVEAVLQRGEHPQLRRLDGVSKVPPIRPDLSIHQLPGYDEQSRLIYDPGKLGLLQIETYPQAQAQQLASLFVDDIYGDFPIDRQGRAAALAWAFTCATRHAWNAAPMFGVDGNLMGTGKTKLVTVGALVGTGEQPKSVTVRRRPEETEKTTVATFLAGFRIVNLDNVPDGTEFPGGAVDSLLTPTSDTAYLRELGGGMVRVNSRVALATTGNNLRLGGDLLRRVMYIRLCTAEEKPYERVGFRHEDLVGYVEATLNRQISITYSLIASFAAAGRPTSGIAPLGSYEIWSRNVRDLVVWLGFSDPIDRSRLVERNETLAFFSALLPALLQHAPNGIRAKEMLGQSWARDAIDALEAPINGHTAKSLGKILGAAVDRRIGDLILRQRLKNGNAYWTAERAKEVK